MLILWRKPQFPPSKATTHKTKSTGLASGAFLQKSGKNHILDWAFPLDRFA